jgi:peptide deformylase
LDIPSVSFVVWLNNKPEVLINPRMISSQGIGSYWESCISSGTLPIGEVHRPWKGIFEYQDKKGRSRRLEADEKQTRVLLHEIDHLNGIVCTERYEPRTTSFIYGGKEEILSYELRRIDI